MINILNTELLCIFIILNIINVIIQTVKSLVTIKSNKYVAALINALAYGFYTIVVVYTVCDLPLWLKVIVVGSCNLVGVFIVKYIEEISKKDRLWKVEVTVPTCYKEDVDKTILVTHSFIELSDKHTLFNFYCATKSQANEVKKLINKYDAKYFVAESKELY